MSNWQLKPGLDSGRMSGPIWTGNGRVDSPQCVQLGGTSTVGVRNSQKCGQGKAEAESWDSFTQVQAKEEGPEKERESGQMHRKKTMRPQPILPFLDSPSSYGVISELMVCLKNTEAESGPQESCKKY